MLGKWSVLTSLNKQEEEDLDLIKASEEVMEREEKTRAVSITSKKKEQSD